MDQLAGSQVRAVSNHDGVTSIFNRSMVELKGGRKEPHT